MELVFFFSPCGVDHGFVCYYRHSFWSFWELEGWQVGLGDQQQACHSKTRLAQAITPTMWAILNAISALI
jgi:hypothetical protein